MMIEQAPKAWQAIDGILVHVGAGSDVPLEAYLTTNAERIVLLEPDPELANTLCKRARANSRVEVIEAAVSHRGSNATLHRYSLEGQATLHPLPAPPQRWPGLKANSQVAVTSQALSELLEDLNLAEDKAHWLILDIPGELLQALKALAEHRPCQPVQHLSLVLGPLTPAVERDWPKLRNALEKAGYRLEEIVGQGEERTYHASADRLWKSNYKLTAELNSANERIESLTEELKGQRDEAEQALEMQRRKVASLQAECSTLKQEKRQLEADNEETQQRQTLLEEELRKAEVQLELIKELFLSNDDAEQLETKERDA